MEIALLSPEVVDQIAAGEVVERPAHLIKELIENSLDAGATEIQIDYSLGGRFVRVVDNGRGISPEDLPLALARHATSKIRATEDLWALRSFGFRGEALASISAVSRLTISSQKELSGKTYRLVSDFGKNSEIELIGGSPGTSILVEELFGNVPARLKFLKSDQAEHQQIRSTCKAMALAHPQVTFRCEENGKLLFYFKACQSRRERVEQVLEISPMFEGSAQRESVKAFAIFSDPHKVQKTSKHIWLFAQGRWVQDRSLQAAVMEAYRHLLMHGEYPSVCIWIDVDPSLIDVNIHPTKSQVKFQDPSLAFRAVQASVRDSLEKAPWLSRERIQAQNRDRDGKTNNDIYDAQDVQNSEKRSDSYLKMESQSRSAQSLGFYDPEIHRTQYNQKSFPLSMAADLSLSRQELLLQLNETKGNNENDENIASNSNLENSQLAHWSSLQVLGQSNLTYILCQSMDGLVIVDQHAAHERVAFERLMQAWQGGKIDVQEFLFPLAIDLSPDKIDILEKNIDLFERLGITLEALGPETLGVKSAPLLLKDAAISAAVEKVATELLDQGGSFRLEKLIGDLCATMACHSVVRAGQSLSREQMQNLLKEMDEFPLSSFCPHGRPVSVHYTFQQLEKDFGRIN